MNPEFWHDRWQRGEIGWHRETINTRLLDFWPQLGVDPGSRVLVPLCGKSRDMLWLAGEGYRVLGVELSPIAVEAFFAENGLAARISVQPPFRHYRADEIEIWCGDFFELDAGHVSGVASVYDRAALNALPPAARLRYAEHLRAILPRPFAGLLVTLDYSQEEMQGPPFAVADREVRSLFGNGCRVDCLSTWEALEENPRFRKRGLTGLRESVYALRADL